MVYELRKKYDSLKSLSYGCIYKDNKYSNKIINKYFDIITDSNNSKYNK